MEVSTSVSNAKFKFVDWIGLVYTFMIKRTIQIFLFHSRKYVWALCPAGYYMQGVRLGAGPPAYLNNIDEAKCCHPQGHPNSFEHCYDEDYTYKFDNKGWAFCKQLGYYLVGIYKSDCNQLYCLEKLRCCKMKLGKRSLFSFRINL